MIRLHKFAISKRPYAVDLDSFEAKWHEFTYSGKPPAEGPGGVWDCSIDAVWFRRRRAETVACIGQLRTYQRDEPKTALDMLAQHTDGRYGGDAIGRWDGTSYWGNVSLSTQQQHLAVLQPMLANYPALPSGYSGWWVF